MMSSKLSIAELDAERSELLPAREALGVFDTNWTGVYAVNAATAANVASGFCVAGAGAVQTIVIDAH